jgi:hypothetical protein
MMLLFSACSAILAHATGLSTNEELGFAPLSLTQDAPADKTIFDILTRDGFTLTKAFYGSDASGPATLKYEHDYLGKVTWGITGALQYAPGGYWAQHTNSFGFASVEANVAQTATASADAYRFRLGIQSNPTHLDASGQQVAFGQFRTDIQLETDQPWRNQDLLAEASFIPWVPKLGLGSITKGDVGLDIRPATIISPGYAMKTTSGDRDVSRVGEDATVSIYFRQLGKSLGFQSVQLAIEDKVLYLPWVTASNEWVNLFSPSLNLNFTKNASLSFSYNIGQDSPSFLKEDKFDIALGLTFTTAAAK